MRLSSVPGANQPCSSANSDPSKSSQLISKFPVKPPESPWPLPLCENSFCDPLFLRGSQAGRKHPLRHHSSFLQLRVDGTEQTLAQEVRPEGPVPNGALNMRVISMLSQTFWFILVTPFLLLRDCFLTLCLEVTPPLSGARETRCGARDQTSI